MSTRVLAQGTFDILHPGHIHYLKEAAKMGSELYVIVARRSNVSHKDPPILPDRQRRDVLSALEVVDEAVIGHETDIFIPVEEIDPDIVVLGHDQHHDETEIASALAQRGIDAEVRRTGPKPSGYDGELTSTRAIVDRILAERGE